MSLYILDTGILVGYARDADYAKYVEAEYSVTHSPNIAIISVVTMGEIRSLAFQFGWGSSKWAIIQTYLNNFPVIQINDERIIEKYAEIDAFSQGKHPTMQLPTGISSRNMGKNDVWIAATGSVLKATLLTTDTHFKHLDGRFLHVRYIDQSLTEKDADPGRRS